ncbi:MAG TPA: hypothetical protein PKM57_06875 [Kiritimatiellia bacterium]|nr:hypothetical protein [Kiritimatiellia bacterium]HPS09694.1 hypothetical protein [Kiritimatiellia bacterium]
MMSTKKRLGKTAKAGALCVLALALQGDVYAADSSVPLEWNVAPMTNGAYLESFDALLPGWAGAVGFSAVTNVFPSMAGSALPVRSNAWFGANVKVLQLETGGEVVSNALAHSDASAVTFGSQPVYVDLRMKFDPLVNPPDQELLANSKMALFLTSEARLVAVHADGASTNAAPLDTNKWYQVTVRLEDGTFDVLLNDAEIFGNLTLKAVGAANTLVSANFYGTGLVDDLYVSHGNPAYRVPGPTAPIPDLPSDGANPPTDEQQTMINAWLNGYPAVTKLSLTQDELSTAYLLGDLNVEDGTNGVAGAYSFGISKIEMVSPTNLNLTAALKVNNADKSGSINGRIQIYGKTEIDGVWTLLEGAITPLFANFVNGEATYNYQIPNPPAGTIIYEEDFDGIETSNTGDSLNAVGWTLSEQFTKSSARYAISNGKLFIDNLDLANHTSTDSYAVVKSSDFMKTYCTNDYTYQYDVTYRGASGTSPSDSGSRYVSLLCNYTGTNVYNTADLRYAGNGYNQARFGGSWPHYDESGALNATGANSMLYKLFGEPFVSSSVTTNALKNRTCTIRVEMSMQNGPTVYVNGLKVSEMTINQANWTATKANGNYAICFKPSRDIKAEIDNIKVWTGCGVEPGGYRFFKPVIVP